LLTPELAQTIVSKIMNIMDKNINIMDDRGYIIASGDFNRTNSYHEGAFWAVKKRTTLEISKEDVEQMEGVKPGINVPIYFDDKVVGVVGITGEPDEVVNYAQLVRYTAELILEQAALKEQMQLHEITRKLFFQDLLSSYEEAQEEDFLQKGRLLGVELKNYFLVTVIQLEENKNDAMQFNRSHKDEINIQREIKQLYQKLRAFFEHNGMFSEVLGNRRIVLLQTFEEVQNAGKIIDKVKHNIMDIEATVKSYKFDTFVGIGRINKGVANISGSYLDCLKAIEIGRCLYPSRKCYSIYDLNLENTLNEVPAAVKRKYYWEIMGEILKITDGEHNNTNKKSFYFELLNTLNMLFQSNLNIKETANKLYVHRNTVLHRIKVIEEITGYNPVNFQDAVKLKVAHMFYQLDSEKPRYSGEA